MKGNQNAFLFLTMIIILGVLFLPACAVEDGHESSENNISSSATISVLPEVSTPTITGGTKTPESISKTEEDALHLTQTSLARDTPCVRVIPGKPGLDMTIPDGTRLLPGEVFIKTWRITNSGSCTWETDFSVIWFSGDRLGAVDQQFLSEAVLPGQSIDISIEMRAPLLPGSYQSNWKLHSADGKDYGIGPSGEYSFWVLIEVVPGSTPTERPALTPTAAPVVFIQGECQLYPGNYFNFDTGAAREPGEDIAIGVDTGMQYVIIPLNGMKIASPKAEEPNFFDCLNANLEEEPISLAKADDRYFCYRTNQGLPGVFFVEDWDSEKNQLILEYITWSIP